MAREVQNARAMRAMRAMRAVACARACVDATRRLVEASASVDESTFERARDGDGARARG